MVKDTYGHCDFCNRHTKKHTHYFNGLTVEHHGTTNAYRLKDFDYDVSGYDKRRTPAYPSRTPATGPSEPPRATTNPVGQPSFGDYLANAKPARKKGKKQTE